jgi:palmitoyltransferase ZDHHC9/14/18
MSHPDADDAATPADTTLRDTANFPSSRTLNSSSRLSNYTEAPTRRSSFQSAQASLYQDTDASLAFDDARESFDLDSDLEVRSQRVASRAARSRTASPFEPTRPRSAASFRAADAMHANRRSLAASEDELETTVDTPASPSFGAPGLARRRSSKRTSVEMSRPLSSLSRRSSISGAGHDEPHNRLRDAAAAAVSRSSLSNRRHSVEIDQLARNISRASTPHGFRTEDEDDDAPAPRPASRSGSSLALRRYDQDGGSFIKRDGRDRGSILPPAAFFAPKKPSARNSTGNLLESTATNVARSTTPLSFRSTTPAPSAAPLHSANADSVDSQAAQEVLEYRTISPTGYHQHARSPSPWGVAASVHSASSSVRHAPAIGSGATDRNDALNPAAAPVTPLGTQDAFGHAAGQASPHSVVRMMASTDPLLPARAIPEATTASGLGLGTLDAAAASQTARADARDMPDQRASLRNGGADAAKTAATAAAVPNGSGKAEPDAVDAQVKSAKRGMRNYRQHKGGNRFLLGGLLMTSSDNPLPFIASYLLLLVLGGLFFGFEAKWLSDNLSPAVVAVFAYVWLLAVVNMGVTAWKDPGVIPRGLDADPPCVLGDTSYEPGRQALADPEDPLAVPVQRVLRIRGQTVQVKWCETCGTYRPPRSSHCRVCDNCVENIDHHCTYLNTCIGRRNYVPFLVFLSASIVAALYVVAFTAARLVLMTKPTTYRYPRGGAAEGYSFRKALEESPVSAVLFVLSLAAAAPLVVLLSYHARLVLRNRSTVEQIRINTARDYGEHKQLELDPAGDDDAASTYGAADRPRRGGLRAWLVKIKIARPRYKDPNPFAAARTRTNVRNALGWRSLDLGSWIDRRAVHEPDTRAPHPRPTTDAPATEAPVWKA